MEKKRGKDNVLFPYSLSFFATMAYTTRLKKEIEAELKEKIISELKEKFETELKEKIIAELKETIYKEVYNELYEKLSERFRRLDDTRRDDAGWEKIDREHEK